MSLFVWRIFNGARFLINLNFVLEWNKIEKAYSFPNLNLQNIEKNHTQRGFFDKCYLGVIFLRDGFLNGGKKYPKY